MTTLSRPAVGGFVVALAVTLTGCGASSPASGTTSSPAPTVAASTASSSAASAQAIKAKVSANTASAEEIQAALEAAGVSNADRWAREVVEYRPYDSNDPDLTSLRQNLKKYNPGEETVNKIVSALTP
jgi:DNA uptake protein ComE-like DNA-binding protein